MPGEEDGRSDGILTRSLNVSAGRDARAVTDGTRVTDGARGTDELKGRPSTTLVRTTNMASAAPRQRVVGRYVAITERLIAYGALLAKSLVYLSLIALVSAIALIYKYVLLALTYAMARLYPEEFDRDAVINALTEVEKDSEYD